MNVNNNKNASFNGNLHESLVTRDDIKIEINLLHPQKDTHFHEVNVIFSQNNLRRTKILINSNVCCESLKTKILECFKNYKEFIDVKGNTIYLNSSVTIGLRVNNLSIRKNNCSNFTPIVKDEIIESLLTNETLVLFDITSDELWIKINISIKTDLTHVFVYFEMKLDKKLLISELKHIIINYGLKYWYDYLKKQDYHYLLYNVEYKTNKCNYNMDFNFFDDDYNFIPFNYRKIIF